MGYGELNKLSGAIVQRLADCKLQCLDCAVGGLWPYGGYSSLHKRLSVGFGVVGDDAS